MVRLLAHAAAPVVYQPHVESRCNAVSLSAQILPESEWRPRAEAHVMRVRDLLAPGFVSAPESERESGRESENKCDSFASARFRALDRRHAVFNFLHDYYNVRGVKGARRLARWSHGPNPVMLAGATEDDLASGLLSLKGCVPVSGGLRYDAAAQYTDADADAATPFVWYRSLLEATERAEPILHCYGTQPPPPPPLQHSPFSTLPTLPPLHHYQIPYPRTAP